jgi:geranylgeranyl diphosphate synthase type II
VDAQAYLAEAGARVDRYLDEALPRADEPPAALHAAMRHLLFPGGKRLRPALAFAAAEAAGAPPERALPVAGAVELIHTYSLVHDDLPCMDDDDERRGRPSVHVEFGEAVALLAGDALLAEAVRLALTYDDPAIARELADATLGMIGGQFRDVTGDDQDLAAVEQLKTGRLFAASIGLGLRAARVPEEEQAAWRAFGDELGLLFQVVDDILDGDGFAERLGPEAARALADGAATRAHERLSALRADTRVLRDVIDRLATRTA